jgi:hypothetical protein
MAVPAAVRARGASPTAAAPGARSAPEARRLVETGSKPRERPALVYASGLQAGKLDRMKSSVATRRARALPLLMVLLVVGHAAHAPHVAVAPGVSDHAEAAVAHGHDGVGGDADAPPVLARAAAVAAAGVAACSAEADVPSRASLFLLLGTVGAAVAGQPVAAGAGARRPAVACRSGPEGRAFLQVFRL